jgi:hypothetical protein
MLMMRRQAGGIKDPELIEPTHQPRHAGSGDLDAIALDSGAHARVGKPVNQRIATLGPARADPIKEASPNSALAAGCG